MFNMSDLSIASYSTEKTYTFFLKILLLHQHTSSASNLLHMLPRQNWDGKLTILSFALNS